MTGSDDPHIERLRREVEYYRRQLDELGGETVKLDYAVSGLRHQLKQKRQAFTILAELQRSAAVQPQLRALFDRAILAINATLDMDRSVVLLPAEATDHYRPSQWLGFPEESAAKLAAATIRFPAEFATGTGFLVANKGSAATPLITEIRAVFDLPYFICLPVAGGRLPLGLLLTGRLKEARPLYPPFDQGDIETLQALASLISSFARLERLERLKRFLSPQVAELIANGNIDDPLRTHRREITAVFIDLRGFTEFAENAEPEEVMRVLHEYHREMGKLILAHEGTLERFTGDGIIALFNDPVPVDNPEERAVVMAATMRDRIADLIENWRKFGYGLDFGIGIAQGFATIGAIGFEQRYDYTAIGSVMNLASRLCGEAKPGQILISQRVFARVEPMASVETVGPLSLKGFSRDVPAYNVLAVKGA
jgi:class 3 adenylate cyclase